MNGIDSLAVSVKNGKAKGKKVLTLDEQKIGRVTAVYDGHIKLDSGYIHRIGSSFYKTSED